MEGPSLPCHPGTCATCGGLDWDKKTDAPCADESWCQSFKKRPQSFKKASPCGPCATSLPSTLARTQSAHSNGTTSRSEAATRWSGGPEIVGAIPTDSINLPA